MEHLEGSQLLMRVFINLKNVIFIFLYPGTIELKEMIEIIGTLYEMEGISQDSAIDRAEKIFSELDFNSDGSLTEEEFLSGCMDDDDLVRLLNAGGIDPDDVSD